MKIEKTERGFGRGEFIDKYGQQCSIQESSLATESCVWLGVDIGLNGKEIFGRMHLTQDKARMLVECLTAFVNTGWLSAGAEFKEKDDG